MSTVGRSSRTPAKHALIHSHVGKEVGVTGRSAAIGRLVWYDLTAGDGVTAPGVPWQLNCSPGLLAYHASKSRKPVVVEMYEVKPSTYRALLGTLTDRLGFAYERDTESRWVSRSGFATIDVFNESGADAPSDGIHGSDAVFALNDPNAITDWSMRPTFSSEIRSATPWYRAISTMGCNPAGLKRLSLDERMPWFGLIEQQRQHLPAHHDLLLAAIEGDSAQWAYLVTDAKKWRDTSEELARTAFGRHGYSLRSHWLRREPVKFGDLCRTLFLTKSEREVVA